METISHIEPLLSNDYWSRKMNNNHKRRITCKSALTKSTPINLTLNRKTLILGAVLITLAVFLLNPTRSNNLVEGRSAIKSIVKGFLIQNLSTRKNFLPLPVPIPVPIEINDPPVYLKGKPKYVNVYKPKPTPQPIVKPTTVYHMPVYSPTYGYMSMDPYSMYAGRMMYPSGSMSGYGNIDNMKSSILSDSDSTSGTAGINFNDYDDEFGNYYVRKSAAAKRRQALAATAFNDDMHRSDKLDNINDPMGQPAGEHEDHLDDDDHNEGSTMLQPVDDGEQIDHVDQGHKRSKRQVYYQSGYNGQTECEGFPLEINLKSRIKMDQVFPIFGRSQIKKCVKKIQLFPPLQDHHDPYAK